MNRNCLIAFALVFALVFVFAMSNAVRGQDKNDSYRAMAPLDLYLIGHDAEIALARSAAPESISRDARVLILGRHGYETAVEGKDGFTCIVQRSWMLPFDNPEFWNPKVRLPLCMNPPGTQFNLRPASEVCTFLHLRQNFASGLTLRKEWRGRRDSNPRPLP